MVYQKTNWTNGMVISSDALNNLENGVRSISLENNIHNGYSVILGGAAPAFSDLHGSYVITVTLPSKTMRIFNSSNSLVKESDASLVSTSYELTNNSTLYWNVDTNEIIVSPFGTTITINSVVLATNSYGVVSTGVFAEFYNQKSIQSQYKDDFEVYLGGVGYKPKFLVYYNYSIDITLPSDNTFRVVNKNGATSTVAMTGQKFTLLATKALWFDVNNKVFVISDFSQNRTNFVLLAFNNYGKITNGYFSKFFYNQENNADMKSYWEDYMATKIPEIRASELALGSGDEFIFITDTHWGDNEKQSPSLIENIKENTGIENVIFGGDIPRAYGTKENITDDVYGFNTSIRSLQREKIYYPIIGNHDFTIRFNRTDTTGFTYGQSQSYNLFGRNLENYTNISDEKMYYYRDNTAQKIRYVFVNTEESIDDTISWGVTAKISQEQADWLINDALVVPDGYQIFVTGHVPIHPDQPSYSSQLDVLRKIFEAVNNKSNLSFDTGYGTTVNHDFSNTNTKIIAYLAGHCHKDTSKNDNGLLHITTGCDAHYGDDVWTRTPQTTSEQLFDVFFIDRSNSKINTVRVGAGENRSFAY